MHGRCGFIDGTLRDGRWRAIRVLGRRVAGDIVEIGNRLIAARPDCEHGEWLPWLDKEFGWGERTAYRYMAVAEKFGAKLVTVTTLDIDEGALYLLSGPTVPEAAARRRSKRPKQVGD